MIAGQTAPPNLYDSIMSVESLSAITSLQSEATAASATHTTHENANVDAKDRYITIEDSDADESKFVDNERSAPAPMYHLAEATGAAVSDGLGCTAKPNRRDSVC